MVSAWASANNMALGQVKVSGKSNEITAIPDLLEVLLLKGCIVTIDAMGFQTGIASKIVEREADYILAVKENQKQLYMDIQDGFRFAKDIRTAVSQNLGHGRIETRKCSVVTDLDHIQDPERWEGLRAIIKIEGTRDFKNSDRPAETATRYYISSLKAGPEDFQKAVRSHWGIENRLHWVLDVAFSEDASRKRTGNSAQNFSILKKIALNLLKRDTTAKTGVKGSRLRAAWSNDCLLKILKL